MSNGIEDKALLDRVRELENALAERIRASDTLLKSQNRYRAVVEDIPAMICRFAPDGTLSFVNSSFCTFFAKYKEELIGHRFFELFPSEEEKTMQRQLAILSKEAPMTAFENRNVGSDGRVTWQDWTHRALFDENDRVIEYQSIGRDITNHKEAQRERAQLEHQIQQARKIEAIGTLAGGIAHDFSNILAAITGYAELALVYLTDKSPARENIQTIMEAADRARELVGLIRLIRLDEETKPVPVQIHPVVQAALEVIRSAVPASVEIREDLACKSEMVLCDADRLQKIVVNLCTNAYQSMRESGGTLTVELVPFAVDANSEERDPSLKPGPYVRLTVSDTGRGMDEKMLERIFDPYFTTKEHDVGTGLGLAVVRGVVRTYGGSVRVSSSPGHGTDLSVLLPVLTTPL